MLTRLEQRVLRGEGWSQTSRGFRCPGSSTHRLAEGVLSGEGSTQTRGGLRHPGALAHWAGRKSPKGEGQSQTSGVSRRPCALAQRATEGKRVVPNHQRVQVPKSAHYQASRGGPEGGRWSQAIRGSGCPDTHTHQASRKGPEEFYGFIKKKALSKNIQIFILLCTFWWSWTPRSKQN